MDESEDDDLKLHRASAAAIVRIKEALHQLVPSKKGIVSSSLSKSEARQKFQETAALLNLFQEDPQLLDPHLKEILPPLVSGFLNGIHSRFHSISSTALLADLAELLYVLCKVRGQKVISRFLDNEPKHIQSMLNLLRNDDDQSADDSTSNISGTKVTTLHGVKKNDFPEQTNSKWELRYVLLLWIAHLMLTPFDLSTISEVSLPSSMMIVDLPPSVPNIAHEVIRISRMYLCTSSKESNAAAAALVKLVLRPDMRRIGLLDCVVRWAISSLQSGNNANESVYGFDGALLFLNGLVASADVHDISDHLPILYKSIEHIFNQDTTEFENLRTSAISRKLAIKILRNIIVQILKLENWGSSRAKQTSQTMLQDMGVLESVIEFLLKSLADRDTQVRYAASKALSVITSNLKPAMAEEIVEAVIDAFNEDFLFGDRSKNFNAVNASKWHGLTLTLSHMLFRRSPRPEQLPNILSTLYKTLAFEQRSATGNSIGGNIRDAANFGLWSLARRYTTIELLAVQVDLEPSTIGRQSALQMTACHLLVAACLDSAGNVRRGSSAALQELIGRHPNTIQEGIALVQTVDYHAVGLRGRAMIEVASDAAKLGSMYRTVLLDGLFGWRGVQAPELQSRNHAATSFGRLTNQNASESVMQYVDLIISSLRDLPHREVEWRQGLMQSLAEVLIERERQSQELHLQNEETSTLEKALEADFTNFSNLWTLFDEVLRITPKDLNTASLRPHLTTTATVSLFSAMSRCSLSASLLRQISPTLPGDEALSILTMCLKTKDAATLQALPQACINLGFILPRARRLKIVKIWIEELAETYGQKSHGQKSFGLLTALASIWQTLPADKITHDDNPRFPQTQIIDILLDASISQDVETRVMAIRNLTFIVRALPAVTSAPNAIEESILEAFERALNDYTINERGDIGSLVRIEALAGMTHVWTARLGTDSPRRAACERAVKRLALERLDKVRLQAARCLMCYSPTAAMKVKIASDVSTYAYFHTTCNLILHPTSNHSNNAEAHEDYISFLTGITSTIGAGSDSLLQLARAALHDILFALPLSSTSGPSLTALGAALLTLLTCALASDRILLPLLETTVYLLDTGLLQRLDTSPAETSGASQQNQARFKWRTLLSLIQKSHFKSTNIPKLLAAIHAYRGLASIPTIHDAVLQKLTGMLAHPYPKIRNAAAETLWVLTQDETLLDVVWTAGVAGNGEVVARLRRRWCRE